jgi:hypothetical protein
MEGPVGSVQGFGCGHTSPSYGRSGSVGFGRGNGETQSIYGYRAGVALSAHPLLQAAAERGKPIDQPSRSSGSSTGRVLCVEVFTVSRIKPG